MKIFFAGGGSGKGVAVNNATKKRTYMKMIEVQAGLGMGIKKFRLVWVFEKQKDLDAFVNSGWEIGGQTSAAAQASGQGVAFAGAMSDRSGSLALPAHRRRARAGTDRQGNEVLQGRTT